MGREDSIWSVDKESEKRLVARLLAADLGGDDYGAARKCMEDIRHDPLNRGQPQRTTVLELDMDDPPPSLILHLARVSSRVNLGIFYIVDTDERRIVFADAAGL